MKSFFAVLMAAVVVLASGWLHGRNSNRFGYAQGMHEAGQLLMQLPATVGPWELDAEHEVSQVVKDLLECPGWVNRTYRNEQSGELIHMAVFIGPHGTISVHTPEVCYSSRDFAQQQERKLLTVALADATVAEFWHVVFQSKNVDGQKLDVVYGFSDGTAWQAAESPRISYVGRPWLYKIQLAAHQNPGDPEGNQRCTEFLQDLLPVLGGHITAESDLVP